MSNNSILIRVIMTFILGIIFGLAVQASCANAADHAIVSFDSPEHLAALQDSVVGVCDTAWVWPDNMESLIDSLRGSDYVPRDTADLCRVLKIPTVTYRLLVGVTVTRESKQQGCVVTKEKAHKTTGMEIPLWDPGISHTRDVHTITAGSPGKAIIFYEPYKEEQCTK